MRDDRLSNGEHDIVYIDQGWKNGILPGDQFEIIHGGEKAGAGRIPKRSVGRLLVLTSQKETATARITLSSEPISKGTLLNTFLRNSSFLSALSTLISQIFPVDSPSGLW